MLSRRRRRVTAGRRIILHVGAPKTGSTYIQKRLRANAAALRARGVYVPVLPEVSAMAGNAKLLATVLTDGRTASFQRAFPTLDLALLPPEKVVGDLLQGWLRDEEDVILSAENFRPSHAARLKALLPKGSEATVVLFIRRQDLWTESYFNQLIKTRDVTASLEDFVHTLCRTEGERLCRPDWLAHHQTWSAHFDQVRLVCYDAVKDTLFESFLAAAGLPPAADLPEVHRAQLALDTFQLAYLMGLSPDMPFPAFVEHRAACEEVTRCDGTAHRMSLLGRASLAEIKERYCASNTRLLERLGRSDLEPLLQPRTSSTSHAPLQDLLATSAFRSFRADVDARFAARRIQPVSLQA